MNIAVYDKDFQAHEVKDVVLNDHQELTQVTIPFKGPVKAVQLNTGDHGYAVTHFD